MLLTVLVGAAFFAALYYPIMLRARSDWRANPAIKSQMLFSCVIVVVLGLVFARQLGLIPPDGVRVAVYSMILSALLVQDATMTNIQNRRASRIERERREGIEALEERR